MATGMTGASSPVSGEKAPAPGGSRESSRLALILRSIGLLGLLRIIGVLGSSRIAPGSLGIVRSFGIRGNVQAPRLPHNRRANAGQARHPLAHQRYRQRGLKTSRKQQIRRSPKPQQPRLTQIRHLKSQQTRSPPTHHPPLRQRRRSPPRHPQVEPRRRWRLPNLELSQPSATQRPPTQPPVEFPTKVIRARIVQRTNRTGASPGARTRPSPRWRCALPPRPPARR